MDSHLHVKLRLRDTGPSQIKLGVHQCILRVCTPEGSTGGEGVVAITDGPHVGFLIQVSETFSSLEEARKQAAAGFKYAAIATYGFDVLTIRDALRAADNVEVLSAER